MADVAERLAALTDLRLPALAPEALIADAAIAVCAGLALAMILVRLSRLFLHRPPTRRQTLLAALARSRALPWDERLLAQARLLRPLAREADGEADSEPGEGDWLAALDRRLGTDFFTVGDGASLREALYRPGRSGRPGAPVDPDVIDREVERLLRRARV